MARKDSRNRKKQEGDVPVVKAAQKISRLLEIPTVSFGGDAQIELSGNKEAIIEGCQGILEYDENLVKLSLGKLAIKFTGRNLTIRSMTQSSVVVEGFIVNIEFLS